MREGEREREGGANTEREESNEGGEEEEEEEEEGVEEKDEEWSETRGREITEELNMTEGG